MISPLPPRLPRSHKGDYGHVVIIGGDLGMGGAVCLSAEAALRVGAGLVTISDAASYGVWLHSHAAELALKEKSTLGNRRSLLAHELFPYLSFS